MKSPTARVSLALALGLAIGIGAAGWNTSVTETLVSISGPVGTLWVNAIRMTVIPLVVSLLIAGIAASEDKKRIGRSSVIAALFFLSTLIFAAAFTTLVAPPFFDNMALDPRGVAALRASAVAIKQPEMLPTFVDWLTSLVPANPVKSAVDGALLPVVVFTIAFAFALTRAMPHHRASVVAAASAGAAAMTVLVGWILSLAPIGVLALAITLGAKLGSGVVGAIGLYVGVVIGIHVLLTLAFYPLVAVLGRTPIPLFARAVAPAQAVAFSSRSSFAALPAMIDGASRVLKLPDSITAFVLPLAVSTYRLTSPIYWPVGAIFVSHLYGVPFDLAGVATIAFAAVILTASAPGIPSGGLFIQAPLYAALGLPVEGIGILIAIDAIPDMFKTALNVTSQLAAATVVARFSVETQAT